MNEISMDFKYFGVNFCQFEIFVSEIVLMMMLAVRLSVGGTLINAITKTPQFRF